MAFHMMGSSVTKEAHTSCLSCNSSEGILNGRNIYCLLFWDRMWCSQMERKSPLLPVINSVKFVETLSNKSMSPTFCCSLSYVSWAAQTSMLLTFFKQVRCSVNQCSITHSLSMRDRIDKSAHNDWLTYLLLVMCTIGSFTKNQHWVMSLTSCRLWDKASDHKGECCSQTVVMRQYIRSMLAQCHLPTDINIIISFHQEYYGDN